MLILNINILYCHFLLPLFSFYLILLYPFMNNPFAHFPKSFFIISTLILIFYFNYFTWYLQKIDFLSVLESKLTKKESFSISLVFYFNLELELSLLQIFLLWVFVLLICLYYYIFILLYKLYIYIIYIIINTNYKILVIVTKL